MRYRLLLVALAMLATPWENRSQAGPYDFVVIASTPPGPFQPFFFGTPPSIDATGAVAFLAIAQGASPEIFVASQPGASLPDYQQITGLPGQVSLSVDAVGSFVGGVVALAAATLQGQQGVYRGSGGALSPIFAGDASSGLEDPAVNASGNLALVVDLELVVANSQGSSVVLQKDDSVAGGTIFDIPSLPVPDINDAGQLAFFADIDFPSSPCDEAFMRTEPGGAVVIALGTDTPCSFSSSGVVPLALNEAGSVAYAPRIFDPIDGQIETAFVDATKVWDERIPGFGNSASVSDIALSDSGTPAFRLDSTSGSGIYTGADPVADKVLAAGDALCGSTVTEIDFHRYGIDGSGRLALFVALADARRLIVRADPSSGAGGACIAVPEPSGCLAATAALFALARVARRR